MSKNSAEQLEALSRTNLDIEQLIEGKEVTGRVLNSALTEGFREQLGGRLFYDKETETGGLFRFVGVFKKPDGSHVIRLEEVGTSGTTLEINEANFRFDTEQEHGYVSNRWELLVPEEVSNESGNSEEDPS